MSDLKGTIFNIQRFSVDDGPGIRTTVFLKGCPLHCLWCHNPESQSTAPEIFYNPEKCIGCRACETVCPNGAHVFEETSTEDGTPLMMHLFLRENCRSCGQCTKACYTEALENCGEEKTTEEVLKEVLRDQAFYKNSGGGMTLSGGEPMVQFEFTMELLKLAKAEGLHVCMETSGFTPEERILQVAEYVDIFLYDCKAFDDEVHRRFTGVSNERILKNLGVLSKTETEIVLRCPMIPGVNVNDAHIEAVAEEAIRNPRVKEIDLLPYHPMGIGKTERLGKEVLYGRKDFLEKSELRKYQELLQEKTGKKVVL